MSMRIPLSSQSYYGGGNGGAEKDIMGASIPSSTSVLLRSISVLAGLGTLTPDVPIMDYLE